MERKINLEDENEWVIVISWVGIEDIGAEDRAKGVVGNYSVCLYAPKQFLEDRSEPFDSTYVDDYDNGSTEVALSNEIDAMVKVASGQEQRELVRDEDI